jgi:hypothetical protein
MPRVTYANVAATVCLLAVAGAITASAFGAFGRATASGTLTACAAKKGASKGLLRLASTCKKGERKVTWNVKGQPGAQGLPGGPGQPGATGQPGAPGQPGVDATSPAGAVMYFDLPACPTGWSSFDAGRGRYLVGLPVGGTPGAAVGTPLSDQENRPTGQHTHAVNDPGHVHAVGYDTEQLANTGNTIGGTRMQGGSNSGSENSDLAFTGITIAPAGAVAGTNAPYLQLVACRKN